MTRIEVRIEGKTEAEIRQGAALMGVWITRIYPKRGRDGYLGYGYREFTQKQQGPRPKLPRT